MGKRSAVEMLPDDVRKQLEHEIRKSRFSGYEQHRKWLEQQGYEISRSAVHRYGQQLQKLAATPEERDLLDIFRKLETADRHALHRFAQILSTLADKEKMPSEKFSDGL